MIIINNRVARGEIFLYWKLFGIDFDSLCLAEREREREMKLKVNNTSKTYLNWYNQNEIFQRKFLSFIGYFVITVKKK